MAKRSEFSLADVAVRPVRDTTERAQWDRLMDEHHYLRFRGMFGVSLRHVAETPDGRWLAGPDRLVCRRLQGRRAGPLDRLGAGVAIPAFAPDREQHTVPDPATGAVANLASRALSLLLHRLSGDMQSRYGFTVQPSGVAGGDLRRPVALCGPPATGRRTGWSWGRRGATRARRAVGWRTASRSGFRCTR